MNGAGEISATHCSNDMCTAAHLLLAGYRTKQFKHFLKYMLSLDANCLCKCSPVNCGKMFLLCCELG